VSLAWVARAPFDALAFLGEGSPSLFYLQELGSTAAPLRLISARVDAASGGPADQGTPEELMEQYVDGSATAFDALYRQVAPRLLSYLLRLTRNRERAEDLLQVTFAKVHRARGSYIRGAPVLPWMLAIARRSFLDERRAAHSRSEDLSQDGTLPEVRDERPHPRWSSLKRWSAHSTACQNRTAKP